MSDKKLLRKNDYLDKAYVEDALDEIEEMNNDVEDVDEEEYDEDEE